MNNRCICFNVSLDPPVKSSHLRKRRREVKKMLLALSKIAVTLRFVTVRDSSILRSTVVLLTISAWLLASNHCAVAGENEHDGQPSRVVASGSGHTHSPSPSPDKDGDESDMACCSSLPATVAQPTTSLVAFDQFSFVPVAYFLLPVVLLERRATSAISSEFDTGPPYSFAEIVLQRSLPSNAPPSLS